MFQRLADDGLASRLPMVTLGAGVTADSCHALLGEGASRAMLYVAMIRGRYNNEAYLHQRISSEADHTHDASVSEPQIHQMRRGSKYSAAQYFRTILANGDRPRTVRAESEHTELNLLPEMVVNAIERNEACRRVRRRVSQAYMETAQAWARGHERTTAAATTRTIGVDLDVDGIEL